jgi:uncharacterized repeat protein (TIGR03803 family)
LGGYAVVHSFTGGADGADPGPGELWADGSGNFYGVTWHGGAADSGTVFKITPAGAETVLYAFCSAPNCSDGSMPDGAVVGDAAGNLYGTTMLGGKYGFGTVFKLSPSGGEKVLWNFKNGTDGSSPVGGLFLDSQGNLFGTTYQGGTVCDTSGNTGGVVFKVYPNGKLSVVHDFTGGGEGDWPATSLGPQSGNLLYGTASGYTCNSSGSLFLIETN